MKLTLSAIAIFLGSVFDVISAPRPGFYFFPYIFSVFIFFILPFVFEILNLFIAVFSGFLLALGLGWLHGLHYSWVYVAYLGAHFILFFITVYLTLWLGKKIQK